MGPKIDKDFKKEPSAQNVLLFWHKKAEERLDNLTHERVGKIDIPCTGGDE